jgi:hypothetical protein
VLQTPEKLTAAAETPRLSRIGELAPVELRVSVLFDSISFQEIESFANREARVLTGARAVRFAIKWKEIFRHLGGRNGNFELAAVVKRLVPPSRARASNVTGYLLLKAGTYYLQGTLHAKRAALHRHKAYHAAPKTTRFWQEVHCSH